MLAIELNPNYANAHQYYSEFFEIIGQNDEARIQINLALSLDPLSAVMHFLSAHYYYKFLISSRNAGYTGI